jgi:hypothetical protein
MLTTAQLETLDAVTADEKTLVASHLEACQRIAELEREVLGQSVRIATTTDV